MYRAYVLFPIWLALATPGCATVSPVGGRSSDSLSTTSPPGVDPSRAYLPLSRIEPVPSTPARPPTLKQLSTRASRQIVKARKLVGEQRYTEAAIELERALRYDPNHPEIHRTLAMLHWEAGNIERAKTHVEKALDGNPDDAVARYIGGRCYVLDGNRLSAITAYRTALLCSDIDRDPEISALCHHHLAEALAAEGFLEAALEQYTTFEREALNLDAAATHPELATLLQSNRGSAGETKSTILEKLGRFAEAAEALAPMVTGARGEVALGLRYARLLMQAGRFDEALAAVRALPSNSNEVIELLFDIHRRAGHAERILDELRLRMAAREDQPALVLSLADMLMRLDRADDARRELRAYLDGHAGEHAVRALLADIHIGESAWDDALRVCAEGLGLEQDTDRTAELTAKIRALGMNGEAVSRLVRPPADAEPPAASYLRGVLAMSAGRLEEAENLFRRACEDRPGFVAGRVSLARLYLRTYRYDEALRIAGRGDPAVPEHALLELVLGELHERLDDIEKAELHFKAAARLNRADVEAMFLLAKLYARSRRGLQAQRQLRVLLENDPNHEAARELLVFTYIADRKIDVAVEELEELQRRATTATTKARCAALLDQVQQHDPAAYRRSLLAAIEQHGPDAATWIAIAESWDPDAEPEKRLEAYRSALAIDPGNEEAALGLVQASQRMLAFEEAAQQLETLLQRRPNRHSWRLGRYQRGRGLIELRWILQDYDAALALARSAETRADLDDLWRERYRVAIVQTLRQAGRDEEVLKQLKTWTELEPDGQEWAVLLAEEYLRQDQAALAIPILETIHKSDPSGVALSAVVQALVAADQHDRASQYILDRLDDDPENDDALFRLAGILAEAKRFDDALELLRNRLLRVLERQRFQDITIAVLTLAKRYSECLDLIEALTDEVMTLMRTVHEPNIRPRQGGDSDVSVMWLPDEPFTIERLHQRSAELRLHRAGVLIAAKEYGEARRQLTSWLDASRDPSARFEYLRRLAFCYRAQGNEPQASEILARALLLHPQDITLNNDVAYGWIDRGIRLDDAQRMIRYALFRAPRQEAYLDTYGWLQYKKGRFAEAKRWLLRATHGREDADPVVQDHLGDTCWRLGESKEAVRYWTAATKTVRERGEDNLVTDDENRVREHTQQKIDDAGAGRSPAVAPLAAEPSKDEDSHGAPDG